MSNLSEKLGHDRLKDLVDGLEVTMKARWVAAMQHKEPLAGRAPLPERETQFIKCKDPNIEPRKLR